MRNRRSLLNFAILIVVAAATAGFVVNKASEAVAEIDALNIYPAFSGRQKAAIDTSGWKTYRNEKYGFEVGYPSDWLIDTSGGESVVVVREPGYVSNHIVIAAGPTLAHGMEFFEKTSTKLLRVGEVEWSVSYWAGYRDSEGIGRDPSERAITAGYYKGRTEYGVEAYYVASKDNFFKSIFDEMLSTFKLIK